MAQHKDFADRLKIACENNSVIPALGKGQQVYIAKHLDVSQEAVRRWFEGENLPRNTEDRPYMKKLAKLLHCDEAWLALGIAPAMDWRHKREYSKKAHASGYIAFGLFMANGHHCSFAPDTEESVDFHTIKHGQHMQVSVTTANETEDHVWEIPVRPTYRSTVNVAMCQVGPARAHFLVLDADLIERFGEPMGGYIAIRARRAGNKFFTGDYEWPLIENTGLLS